MWKWVVQNKEWLFSGAGLTALGIIWWVLAKLRGSRREPPPATSITQAPTITVSPTFNISQETRTPEPPKQEPPAAPPSPVARANLKIEATKVGKIYLQGDIWTLAPLEASRAMPYKGPYRGLFADVANVPTGAGSIKAVKVKAVLTIQLRSYSPLPWLEEYTNAVSLEPAARKAVILAVGEDRPVGAWHFVLNHRDRHGSLNEPSRMDWTNLAPILSDLPLEVLLVDVNSGELVAKFEYLWTFDANTNWPFLKIPPIPADQPGALNQVAVSAGRTGAQGTDRAATIAARSLIEATHELQKAVWSFHALHTQYLVARAPRDVADEEKEILQRIDAAFKVFSQDYDLPAELSATAKDEIGKINIPLVNLKAFSMTGQGSSMKTAATQIQDACERIRTAAKPYAYRSLG